MAQNCIGIDIGHDNLRIVLVSGLTLKKAVSVPVPENLVKNHRIVSFEAMGELIRNAMRQGGFTDRRAAIALSDDRVYLRNIMMPEMTIEQLEYNLPYEFRDYITDELKDYLFDYAVIPKETEDAEEEVEEESDAMAFARAERDDMVDDDDEGRSLNIVACAAPADYVDEVRGMLRKIGLKMEKAAPAAYAYSGIVRNLRDSAGKEYCFMDLGYEAIRMHMFKGDNYIVTRTLEIGMSSVEQLVADTFRVDLHLAHTYLCTNHARCQESDACTEAFNNIAVELQRALNFYQFSNPESRLEHVWVCGGGAAIKALVRIISQTVNMNVHEGRELIPGSVKVDNRNAYLQAFGIALI